jgi:hypothetical protein
LICASCHFPDNTICFPASRKKIVPCRIAPEAGSLFFPVLPEEPAVWCEKGKENPSPHPTAAARGSIEADPPLHTRTRAVLARILSLAALKTLREEFEREAQALVDRIVARGSFDAIQDLAAVYPLKVFPDALGLPPEGRENLQSTIIAFAAA